MTGLHNSALVLLSCSALALSLPPLASGAPRVQFGNILILSKGGEGVRTGTLPTQHGFPPLQPTTATVSWDDAGLIIRFECHDDEIIARERPRDDPDMWLDDCVDLFLDPGHTHDRSSRWVHILMSAAGSVYDERGPATVFHPVTGETLAADTAWNPPSLKTSVERAPFGWKVEIFLAWDDLGGKPGPGDLWGFNLGREDYPAEEYTCWSPTYGPFARMHRWGHILFVDTLEDAPALLEAARPATERQHQASLESLDSPLERYFRHHGRGGDANPVPFEPEQLARRDAVTVTVRPADTGLQLVRISLPMPRGLLHDGQTLAAFDGRQTLLTGTRILTWYAVGENETSSARRVLVTFPYKFDTLEPVRFILKPALEPAERPALPVTVALGADALTISYENGPRITARLVAPPRVVAGHAELETIESTPHFLWQRLTASDPAWPRVIEVRIDSLGTVTVVAHLQNWNTQAMGTDNYFLTIPYLGWELYLPGSPCRLLSGGDPLPPGNMTHVFGEGARAEFLFDDGEYRLYHPTAHLKRRGLIEVTPGNGTTPTRYRYLRAMASEAVPMQAAGWRKAEFVISPSNLSLLRPTLEYAANAEVDWRLWDELYQSGPPLERDNLPGDLAALIRYHRDATLRAMAIGDDWGCVTMYQADRPSGTVGGVNRLNHCHAIFEEAYRSNDRHLLETAVLWCENFHDLSIYWGAGIQYGGSRYPNFRRGRGLPPGVSDQYEWRSDAGGWAFTTKGPASFFIAYEQTGDPRMLKALDAQLQFDMRNNVREIAAGSTRSIGIAIDFIRVYRWTGRPEYLQYALEMFRALRRYLQPNHLFTEGGGPPTSQTLFVPHDSPRHAYHFFKPYILGYALEALPDLLLHAPDEPQLRDCVAAVADFMVSSQDPLGAWRYPHPLSPLIMCNQSTEHAHQIVNADRVLGAHAEHLDAIERFLRLRLHTWQRTGRILSFAGNWGSELARERGEVPPDLQEIYHLATDRDAARDYTDGVIDFANPVPPEGLVYLPNLLRFYLAHRPAERLLAEVQPDTPLGKILARIPLRVE